MSPVLAHWSASLAGAGPSTWRSAGAHLAGTAPAAGLAAQAGRRAVISEAALFQAGLLLALLAIVSPLRYWSGIYIWVRALQDLVLAVVAPGLIVVGAPWPALARSVAGRRSASRCWTARQPGSGRPGGCGGRWPRWWRST